MITATWMILKGGGQVPHRFAYVTLWNGSAESESQSHLESSGMCYCPTEPSLLDSKQSDPVLTRQLSLSSLLPFVVFCSNSIPLCLLLVAVSVG